MDRPRVAIVGVGLMGGSLGMALVRSGKWRVTGVGRRPARLAAAKRRRAIHDFVTDMGRLSDVSVAVLAAPVDEIAPLARRIRPALRPDALVTDLGSVKAPIVRALEKIFSRRDGPRFIGAHPMAGSEKTGVENARPDLYKGATCVLTPGRRATPRAAARAAAFWRSTGARVVRMRPEDHDRWVAAVSHLPHLIADALVLSVGSMPGSRLRVRDLAAGSFRDATRVAGADPRQWAAIFKMNRAALRGAASRFQRALAGLARRDSAAALGRARRLHDAFMNAKRS